MCVIITVFLFAAIMAKILSKVDETVNEHTKGWEKFLISVESVYKKARDSRIRRGTMSLIVPSADLECKCPKLKISK